MAQRGFMPGAIVKNIAPGSNDPVIHPVGVIAHVAVSRALSLFNFFRHDGGIESHFYIRKNGKIEQYRSIYYEADAQSRGNSFIRNGVRCGFVSVETEGMGPGTWTAAQVESFKHIVMFVDSEAPFPLRKCPGPYEPGVGYHRQFTQWNPNRHSCPGNKRVQQFDQLIVPWLAGAARGLGHAGSSVGGGLTPRTPPRFNPANYYLGAHGPWVIWLGKRLIVHGCNRHSDGNGYQPGPTFTKYDRANVRDFQRAQGWTGSDADGFPGPETLRRLKAAPKHKAPPKPAAPQRTRIDNFRARYKKDDVLDLAILRRAVKGGRTGTVADVLHALEQATADLPRH